MASKLISGLRTCGPDVVVTDLSLPGISGLELISRIKQRDANAKILVFSMHQNPGFAVQASRAGALGYVTKSSPPEVLLRAIHEVHGGRHTLSADIAQALALEKLGNERMALETLTVREFEILRFWSKREQPKRSRKPSTSARKPSGNCHYLIKRKLGVAGDIELTRLAIRLNVINLLDLSVAAAHAIESIKTY